MDKIVVYIIHKDTVKNNLNFVLSLVDESRKEKALKLQTENGKYLSLGAAYLMKKYLPNKPIKENAFGKPYIEGGPFFNVSHSGEYAVLAIHQNREIGVDIERIDENKTNAIRYTLTNDEKQEKDVNVLFEMWSNKESLIKCIGSSINDIKKVPALPLEGKREVDNITYFSKSQLFKNYSLSVTLQGCDEFELSLEEITL